MGGKVGLWGNRVIWGERRGVGGRKRGLWGTGVRVWGRERDCGSLE